MRIGLLSDIHADPEPLGEALRIFTARGVDMVLCAGDIAGYGEHLPECIELLKTHACKVVLGNHDLWHLEDWQGPPRETEAYLRDLPRFFAMQIEEVDLHMVHASPLDPLNEGISLRAVDGSLRPDACRTWRSTLSGYRCDVLVVGHTHQVFAVELGRVLIVNPGSCHFNHSCAILHLPHREVEVVPLLGQQPLLSWNFGHERRGGNDIFN